MPRYAITYTAPTTRTYLGGSGSLYVVADSPALALERAAAIFARKGIFMTPAYGWAGPGRTSNGADRSARTLPKPVRDGMGFGEPVETDDDPISDRDRAHAIRAREWTRREAAADVASTVFAA